MTEKHVIIVGGGIQGVCSAYYLLRDEPKCKVTLFEKTGIASSASGKAGGFLALDWNDQTKGLKNLARHSFKLHRDLSQPLDGAERYGYRAVDTYSVILDTKAHPKPCPDMDWVKAQNIRSFEQIGDQNTTAQVTPGLFTKTLLEEAQKTGRLDVCIGKGVTELVYDENIVTGVQLEGGDVFTGDAVVLCMGAWTGNLALKKGERIPVSGVRVHSIVMRPDAPIPNQALFTAILDNSKTSEPEVYPRPDGTVYLCGSRDDEPLPASSGDVGINNSCINDLIYQASIVSNHLSSNVEKKQACYLPIPDNDNGLPIIGPHPYYKSLYLATGHSVWGILNGPGTGKLISEWIIHGLAKCVKYGKPDL